MMIAVYLNKEDFVYDIHSLVKAFYPSENVSVCAGTERIAAQNAGQETEAETLSLTFQSDQITVELTEPSAAEKTAKRTSTVFPVDFADRPATKNALKRQIYSMLSAYTGRTLPWGTLTGIRPVKIPMALLEAGKTEAEIASYMERTYQTSKEKISLSIEIARRERKLLDRLDYEKGYSLYIGIPFCPSTCLYCSFTSYPWSVWKDRMDDYLDALEKEIVFTAHCFSNRVLNSIYIGGGTPTTLSPRQFERLAVLLKQSFDLSHVLEYTVEAGRPDSIDREKLQVLRAQGVTRISINPQTMKQETLDLIGRRHIVAQTADSFRLARSMGFTNINMDLIMGLPQETLADVQHTMDELKKLDPDSITVHSLAVKRAARLQMFREDYTGFRMENTQEHLDTAAAACAELGMQPYYLYRQKNMVGNFENIGYAKSGKEGIYNILIMEEKQSIAACGAGSISKRVRPGERMKRCENVKDVALYIQKIDEMIERKQKLFADS